MFFDGEPSNLGSDEQHGSYRCMCVVVNIHMIMKFVNCQQDQHVEKIFMRLTSF